MTSDVKECRFGKREQRDERFVRDCVGFESNNILVQTIVTDPSQQFFVAKRRGPSRRI